LSLFGSARSVTVNDVVFQETRDIATGEGVYGVEGMIVASFSLPVLSLPWVLR
jgi:hypothetical protein